MSVKNDVLSLLYRMAESGREAFVGGRIPTVNMECGIQLTI